MDNEYIFTFGSGQLYENGFFAITADSPEEARERMEHAFGMKWSMQYNAPNAREKAGVDEYKLKEVR